MNLNPYLHHEYALDRQRRLQAEAAASRLAGSVRARTRIALLPRRSDRLDAATASGGQAAGALTHHS